ncbi:MAG: hypothetical protein FJZ63_06745 [Chlamydiae bacterium]|nr:hypothetical protein [Chlamydiota bacterium]
MPVSPLTPAEQQFAAQLSSLHKQIFTTVFTPQLRQEAMTLMSPDAQSNLGDNGSITADMAVEEVVSNHRDMPMNGMPSGTQGNSSSMPTQPSSNKAGKYWTN